MRTLAVNGYPAASVEKELLKSGRTLAFRYERYDKNNLFLGPFSGIIDGSVDHASFADIAGTAKFSIKSIEGIDWSNDRCKPFVRLKMPDGKYAEWSMGLFLLSSPAMSPGKIREIDAYDQSFILLMDKVSDRYSVASGSVVTEVISTILAGAGIPLRTVVPSALTLPTARDWDPGTPKATIVNALLSSINYQALWFDGDGYAVCRPYMSPSVSPTGWTYRDDASSMLTREGSRTLDLFDVPNKWVLYVSDPDRPPLRSEYTNASMSSPTSTASRGFTIVDYREETDAVDQATLDAKVAIIAYGASQIYEKVVINTGLMPMHEHFDVLSLRYGLMNIEDRYQETGWSMSLKVGAKMSHSLRKLVSL